MCHPASATAQATNAGEAPPRAGENQPEQAHPHGENGLEVALARQRLRAAALDAASQTDGGLPANAS